MTPSPNSILGPPGLGGEGTGVKPGPKLSLDRWGCACIISARLVQEFGFQLALHIPTDKQASVFPFIYREIQDRCIAKANISIE